MPHPLAVTDATFEHDVLRQPGLTIVDFWAAWCGPCRMLAPVLDQLADEYAGQVRIAKLDVDANPATATRYQVRSIPLLLFFKDGREIDQIVGAVPRALVEQRLQAHLR